MSKTTIGEVLSRVRNQLKAVRQDAFLTDRFLYSVVSKHAKWLMKREDSQNKLMKFNSIFNTLDNVPLIEVDRIEGGCTGLSTNIKMMRTRDLIPVFMQGYWGPLIRQVTSLDGQIDFQPLTPTQYVTLAKSKNFKYNTTNYYWYLNDYLYFPDIEWPSIRIEGVFEGDISEYKCIDCKENHQYYCISRQDDYINIPDYLFGEIETNVMKDMSIMLQIPTDDVHDNKNTAR
tara:strand:+ start:1417 stop:2109 length:693 start_codon:yes stop_codon:yes gene_type:complete